MHFLTIQLIIIIKIYTSIIKLIDFIKMYESSEAVRTFGALRPGRLTVSALRSQDGPKVDRKMAIFQSIMPGTEACRPSQAFLPVLCFPVK